MKTGAYAINENNSYKKIIFQENLFDNTAMVVWSKG